MFSAKRLAELQDWMMPGDSFPESEGYDYCFLSVPRKKRYQSLKPDFFPLYRMLMFYDGDPEAPLEIDVVDYSGDLDDTEVEKALLAAKRTLFNTNYFWDYGRTDQARQSLSERTGITDNEEIVRFAHRQTFVEGRPLGQLVLWADSLDMDYGIVTSATLAYELAIGPSRLKTVAEALIEAHVGVLDCPVLPTDDRALGLDHIVSFDGFPSQVESFGRDHSYKARSLF